MRAFMRFVALGFRTIRLWYLCWAMRFRQLCFCHVLRAEPASSPAHESDAAPVPPQGPVSQLRCCCNSVQSASGFRMLHMRYQFNKRPYVLRVLVLMPKPASMALCWRMRSILSSSYWHGTYELSSLESWESAEPCTDCSVSGTASEYS